MEEKNVIETSQEDYQRQIKTEYKLTLFEKELVDKTSFSFRTSRSDITVGHRREIKYPYTDCCVFQHTHLYTCSIKSEMEKGLFFFL